MSEIRAGAVTLSEFQVGREVAGRIRRLLVLQDAVVVVVGDINVLTGISRDPERIAQAGRTQSEFWWLKSVPAEP